MNPGRPGLGRTFASLKYPNYRKWFIGQTFSLAGSWMQMMAQGFLVYELTHSTVWLGYVGFANGLPMWLFTLFGGLLSDRLPRRSMLLATQTAMMATAGALAALTLAGRVEAWHIVALSFVMGTANAFDAPTRMSFVRELVEKEDLANAIALNTTMFQLSIVIGPGIAGLVYAAIGPGWCFLFNSVSFIGIIAALAMMRLPAGAPGRRASALSELRDGLRYVAGHADIRAVILVMAACIVFGFGFSTLLPAWSVKILGGDATTNGILLSARGFGALAASLMIASLGRFEFKGRLLTAGTFFFPVLLALWSMMSWQPFSIAAIMGTGWAFMLIVTMANTVIQSLVEDRFRGRVMSIMSLAHFGTMPLAALLAGWGAQLVGERLTVAAGAAAVFVFALGLRLFAPRLRELK